MNVTIPCELYSRMIDIAFGIETNNYLRSLYIERKNNQLFAVVTNINIAAIEFIRLDVGPDECVAIIADKTLDEQCIKETKFNGQLYVVSNPVLGFTTIKTGLGYVVNGNSNVVLPENNHFKNWRTWFPDKMPDASFGSMYWNSEAIYLLSLSSPSGGLHFPEFIDANKPVVIRDFENDKWVGLFMPTRKGTSKVNNATIPEWATS